MRAVRLLVGVAALLLPVGADAQTGPPLPGPFGPPGPAAPLSARACPTPPAPVVSLMSEPFYTDRAFSIPDPARVAADRAAAAPLEAFLDAIQRPAERWVALRDPAEAACAIALLDAWARGGALTGDFNRQANYHRKWTLSGLALTWLALRDAPAATPERAARIGAWLGGIGHALRPTYEQPIPAHVPATVANNHAAWAGLAMAAAGVAACDRALLAAGMARGEVFLGGVDAEGAHPHELARGRLATHYHAFALQAAAGLARVGAAAGTPLSPAGQAALDRLARFTLAALQDQTRIAARAGVAQAAPDQGRAPLTMAQGIEVLGLAEALLAPYRPYRSRRLGGNVTLLWARPADLR